MGLNIQDTTYAGEVASNFLVKAMTGADTIQGGHVYLKDNIKKDFTIKRFQYTGIIQDVVPTPSSKGSATVDGKKLHPNPYMIYFEFDPNDFEDHWDAVNLNKEYLDRSLPSTVESVLIQEVFRHHANYFDTAIWQSDKTRTDEFKYFDGIITNALNDPKTIDVAGATLNAGNIEAKLDACLKALPKDYLYDFSVKFFVSYATAQLWEDAQYAGTYKGSANTERALLKFKGRTIVPIAGFPDDTIFVAKSAANPSSNLWVGMNSTSDDTNIKLAPVANNSDLWFIKAKMKADVQIGWAEETVLCKP